MGDPGFSFREAFVGIRRSGLLAVSAVVVMSLSFLMLGLFLLLTVNLRHAVHLAQERVEVAAYVEDGIVPNRIQILADSLWSLPGVKDVRWVSKADARERFMKELGTDAALLESLEENPLPASFEIAIYDDYKTPAGVQALAERIQALGDIEHVDSGLTWVTQLTRAITVVAVLDLVFGLVVVFATVVSVGSTIKLALIARQETIQILKLVGATDWFIRSPFLIEGIFEGAVAAGGAAALLWASYLFAAGFLPDLRFLSGISLGAFVVAGSVLGGLGALVAVRGFLRKREGCS